MFHRRPHLPKASHLRTLIVGSTSTAATGALGSESDVSSYLARSYEDSIRSGHTRSNRDRRNSSGSPLARRGTRANSIRSNRSLGANHDSSGQSSEDLSRNDRPSSSRGSEGDNQVCALLLGCQNIVRLM